MDINSYRSKGGLKSEELLSLQYASPEDVLELIFTAKELKTRARFGDVPKKLKGKNVFLITKNSVSKSRIAFEIATRSLEANPIALTLTGSRLDELINDPESLKIISGYGISSIVVDTEISKDAEIISRAMNAPVIDFGEYPSPVSTVSALLTVWEKRGKLNGHKAVFVGNPDSVDCSLFFGFAKCGLDVTLVCPELSDKGRDLLDSLSQFSDASFSDDIDSALKNADVIFPLSHDFGADYVVTSDMISALCPNAILLHDTPVLRGKTAESEVFDLPCSAVTDYGVNGMHALRAAIFLLSR